MKRNGFLLWLLLLNVESLNSVGVGEGGGDGHFGACLHHVTNSRVRSRLCVVPCIYYC